MGSLAQAAGADWPYGQGHHCLQPRAHERRLLLVKAVPLEPGLLLHATCSAAPRRRAHYKARLYECMGQVSRGGLRMRSQRRLCTVSCSEVGEGADGTAFNCMPAARYEKCCRGSKTLSCRQADVQLRQLRVLLPVCTPRGPQAHKQHTWEGTTPAHDPARLLTCMGSWQGNPRQMHQRPVPASVKLA